MRKLTLGSARDTIKKVVEKCSTHSDVAAYINEAQERLLNRPNDPIGSLMRYRVCVGTDNSLVMPRQVRSIRAYWLCEQPGRLVSEWWEAIGYENGGIGLQDTDSHPGRLMIDYGRTCCFKNVSSSSSATRKIQVVAQNAADNGKKITLRYIDSSGNRVYSSIDGVVQEGERLTLSTDGALTSSNVGNAGLYHVIKETTNYPVRIYSYNPTTSEQVSLLGLYEPSENEPIYRKYAIPGLTDMAGCDSASDDCSANKTLTVLLKLQHVPVVVDNDPLVIGNLAALKLMVKGIKMEERHETELAEYYFNSAARELDGEISSYLGEGVELAMKVQDTETWGAGGIWSPN